MKEILIISILILGMNRLTAQSSLPQIEELYDQWRQEQIQLGAFCDECEPASLEHLELDRPQFALPPFQNLYEDKKVGYAEISAMTADYNDDKKTDYLFEIVPENCDRGNASLGVIYLLFLSKGSEYYIDYNFSNSMEDKIKSYINKRLSNIDNFDYSRNIASPRKKIYNLKIEENYIIHGNFDMFLDNDPSCCPSNKYIFTIHLKENRGDIMKIYDANTNIRLDTFYFN